MLCSALHFAAALAALPADPTPEALPALVAARAARRRDRVALRHKRRGLWRAVTWAELQDGVARAARGLAALGFAPGDTLAIAGQVRAPALVALLAAQAAGGRARLLDPARAIEGSARFAYAEDAVQVARLRALAPSVLIAGDLRGVDGDVLGWDDVLAAGDAQRGDLATVGGDDVAIEIDDELFRHEDLLAPASARVNALGVGGDDTGAVAAPASWRGVATSLLAEWLLTGFTLGIPEDASTADADVAALAPTYLSAPAAWYDRRWLDAEHRLPAPGTRRRRIVDGALATRAPAGWRAALDRVLVRAPLRGQLGLRAVRVAATSDGALRPEAATFFAALGVAVRTVGAIAGATARATTPPLVRVVGAAG